MNYYLLLLGILCTLSIYIPKESERIQYLEKKSIEPIKGVFILLVFASHFVSYIPNPGINGQIYLTFRRMMGQAVIAPFLFFSGYGVMAQRDARGIAYINSLPQKRILKVFLQMTAAVGCYVGVQALQGTKYSFFWIALSTIGWNTVGNSNWYIFAILMLYIFTWMSFRFLPNDSGILGVILLSFVYVTALQFAGRPVYCYNTVFCYSAGMVYHMLQKKIEEFFLNDSWNYMLSGMVLLVLFVACHSVWETSQLAHQLFCIVMVILLTHILYRVRLKSRFLTYCGEHLFGLYIMQRLPMMVLKPILNRMPYLYLAISLVCTILLSHAFDWLFARFWVWEQNWVKRL